MINIRPVVLPICIVCSSSEGRMARSLPSSLTLKVKLPQLSPAPLHLFPLESSLARPVKLTARIIRVLKLTVINAFL